MSTKALPESAPPLEPPAQVLSPLCGLGFGRSEASAAVGHVLGSDHRASATIRFVFAPSLPESSRLFLAPA